MIMSTPSPLQFTQSPPNKSPSIIHVLLFLITHQIQLVLLMRISTRAWELYHSRENDSFSPATNCQELLRKGEAWRAPPIYSRVLAGLIFRRPCAGDCWWAQWLCRVQETVFHGTTPYPSHLFLRQSLSFSDSVSAVCVCVCWGVIRMSQFRDATQSLSFSTMRSSVLTVERSSPDSGGSSDSLRV